MILSSGKGFDVLHVKVEPFQILWPRNAQAVVGQIVDFLMDGARRTRPILVHGFSVGGYLYGETLVKTTSDPVVHESFAQRIRGQIFDSPVDFEGVPRGVGMAITDVPILQKTIKATLDGYLGAFRQQVMQHYVRSSATFRQNPLRTPSLVFYSHKDPIGTAGPIESLVDGWRQQGIPVMSRSWPDTPHVGHFLHDPVGYIGPINDFLVSIGMQSEGAPEDARRTAVRTSSKL